jgi:hypothetical protein
MPDVRTRITGEVIALLGETLTCSLSREVLENLPEVLLSKTLWRGLDVISMGPDGKPSDAVLEQEWNNWGKRYIDIAMRVLGEEVTDACKASAEKVVGREAFESALEETIKRMHGVVDRARRIAEAGTSEDPAEPEIARMLAKVERPVPRPQSWGDWPFCG